ncbi:methyl-accepting chemotaxis protein [uncultured Aquabacterium sp.]|jgi:methyl-accepting chemotaxis protein|uniref:methyl-accepting chemotaxis protein n=1 Tax=uncultured Aquabacterium sp. TaxID=158753 RepID=UPI002610DD3A|nr:methyl-accepting chemotaxis protein [uncultured Aquabacterium sp.]
MTRSSSTPFGIAGRLMAVVVLLTLVLVGTAVYATRQLGEVEHLALRAEKNRVPQLTRMAHIELNVTRVSLQLRHAMLARTPAERQAALDDIGAKRRLIDEELERYRSMLLTDTGRQRYAALPDLVKAFWKTGEANIALIQQDRKDEAFAFLVEHTIPARNALLKVLADTVEYQSHSLAEEVTDIQNAADGIRRTLLAAFALLIAGLIGFALWTGRTLRQRVRAAQAVAERVRDGDLASEIRDEARDELSPLVNALAEMQAALARVVSGVRSSAESVATASREIALGNQNLSVRTESQASALEETAATMDQLGATVHHNAQQAQQATQLAEEAASVAVQGGTVVGNVVQTMQGISSSSRQIADIISVIDGIAFQTNILALNAAVEAARAGEQGRGFAVVASEVRNLAQRSAEAAREIKSLIQGSVEQVEQGATLVQEAGETMDGIVRAITRVNEIVREISTASREQSAGIGQIGQAIDQMDQSTQQNAALVEESAAATQSMNHRADELVQAVAAFRLRNA